jgi:hypothetical protein
MYVERNIHEIILLPWKSNTTPTPTTTNLLYSPSSALASCAIRLHKSVSWVFLLHSSIPIARKSS